MPRTQDADGDSRMDSSSSSDTDSMFPSENEPRTPQQGSNQAARFPNMHGSDLSPPRSQERGGDGFGEHYDAMEADLHPPELEPSGRREREAKEPGWGWKNPKALEEAERSMEHVVDRSFSLREFGELFEEKDIPGLGNLKQ